MSEAEIGLIGLGTMGSNLALNIAEKGHRIAVWNRTGARTKAFVKQAGPLADNIVACDTLEELMGAIRPPRPVIMMVPAGDAVDEQIAVLRPMAAQGDILIDAGNANFHDTERRTKDFENSGIAFVGMGVSGGEEGARHGPSIMVGAEKEAWQRIEKIVTDIAAKYEDEACAAWLGTGGAGHFVKTIHNGIEYADMQMIAEIYGILRDGLGLGAADIGAIFARWNEGRLNSYLIEITATVLAASDPDSGMPVVDVILDKAGQKGTGRWSVIEAAMLGVPATGIEAAVAARGLSALKKEREGAAKLYAPTAQPSSAASQADIVAELESALLAGKIAAYAQGFAVMQAASAEHGWNLPMATVARIWRAGCIIRSQFLGEIAQAFEGRAKIANLMVAPAFVDIMSAVHPALRITVGRAALQGLPTPALSASLAYFDGYRQARGTANLIQAQRDFFGAHGFEKIGTKGEKHGPWAGSVSGKKK
ncbi:MAG: NADP-dependent phosphogluconate dehydrogenase [Rhizobiaceae bacterium]|nr:NADP-dependent phosphogluconate dehydrogenase [Rhizobiaceae bacterium]